MTVNNSVPARLRLAVALPLALLAAQFAAHGVRVRDVHSDFGQVWFAAGAVLSGQDPYRLIGPGLAFEWPAPFFYPLPAALLATPLAPLTEAMACWWFVFAGAFALAWALMSHGLAPLWAFTSVCVWHAFALGQWSPLLSASLLLAPLSSLLVAKPTIGLAMFAARPSWWAVGGGLSMTALAFVVQPDWIMSWREALDGASLVKARGAPYVAPLAYPGGVLVLTALTRWRRPEARLLATMACVPHTLLLYEAVPLFLIPRGWVQSLGLAALSYVAWWMATLNSPYASLALQIDEFGRTMTVLLYLPATLMVLRRPNSGPAPAWVEAHIARWPSWIRGRASA